MRYPVPRGYRTSSRELLKTYCADELRASGARRTLGTCPLLDTNFARSQRFLEFPSSVDQALVRRFSHFAPGSLASIGVLS